MSIENQLRRVEVVKSHIGWYIASFKPNEPDSDYGIVFQNEDPFSIARNIGMCWKENGVLITDVSRLSFEDRSKYQEGFVRGVQEAKGIR